MTITKDQSVSFPSQSSGHSWREDIHTDINALAYVTRTRTAVRTRQGDRLPKWKSVIESGGNATTNLTARWDSLDDVMLKGTAIYKKTFPGTNAVYFATNTGDILNTNNIAFNNPVVPQMSTDFVVNLARAAFFKKLHNVERQFQGLVFLGELTETLHMLKHPAQNLQNLAKDYLGKLRKRKLADPKRWMNDLGGLWLENSFGWQPLLNDIKDAAKAWDRFTSPDRTQRISASAKKYYDMTFTLGGFAKVGDRRQVNGGCWWRQVSSTSVEVHTCRFKGGLRAQVECPRWGDVSLFGFQPKEFVPALWELLPWSFLIDYFTNIGDILDASVTSTRDLLYLNQSILTETVRDRQMEVDPTGTDPAAGWKTEYSSGNRVRAITKRKDFTRLKNVGFSLPTFQANFSLSDGQLGNCAALLSQANALHPQQLPRHWHR